MRLTFCAALLCLTTTFVFGQAADTMRVYRNDKPYEVRDFTRTFSTDRPRNVILMIGDGMGIAQVFAAMTANHGRLFLDNFKCVGYSRTQAANRYITDSAAGATALSTGKKTYNGAIAMVIDAKGDTVAAKTVLEIAEERGMSTGLVATCALSHATPASFIAHQPSRSLYDDIGADYLKTDVDVMIGGGYKNFADRKDGLDLIAVLKQKGYRVERTMEDIAKVKSGKLAGITAYAQNPPVHKRDLNLPLSTTTAINILKQNEKGFFLMVEGSQIDWGSHNNNTTHAVSEMLDFDQAIGRALEFAYEDGNTLIVVTADHETGGMALTGGSMKEGWVRAEYISGGHTGIVVPVFAYGPGAEAFMGFIENTDIGNKIIEYVSQ